VTIDKGFHMAQSIPFDSRSTADQVLAGVDLSRKRVLVTGCDSAVGLETMKALSANGAVMIGVARTPDDAKAACAAIAHSTAIGCDSIDLASVDAAIESLRQLAGPLDAVIINSSELRCFADYVAQFVFVNRLAEFVRPGTGRIVIASEDRSAKELPIESAVFDDLSSERIYDPRAFHGQTQLAAALFVEELSRRLDARGVTVNAFRSGTTGDHDSRGAQPAARRLIRSLLGIFARSPAQHAATPALLAASPLVVGITGGYWLDCQISLRSSLFGDPSIARRLWDVSVQIAAMMFGRVNSSSGAASGSDSLHSSFS
jgi:NAD(P)-dependent dehydrogenase (short-subunit alcohol dehydrogenase family)